MVKAPKGRSGRMNLASCVVATIFLFFLLILLSILYFTLFKPRPPNISVAAVQLLHYSATKDGVNFTYAQYVAIRNPNRAGFAHYDSSLQLHYAGNQVGFMFIPASYIPALRTKYMVATFPIQSFSLVTPSSLSLASSPESPNNDDGFRVGPAMQLDSTIKMAGRIRVFHFFTHHLEAKSACTVTVAIADGTVQGFRC